MAFPNQKRLNHEAPHWVDSTANYFITICAEPRKQNHFCHPELGSQLLESIRFYHETQRWYCYLALLMPDHIHLLLCFPPDKTISKTVGSWKQAAVRQWQIPWQRNFFDHRLRNDEGLQQKANYILHNPVRAGLIADSQNWPYFWMGSG